MSEKNQKSRKYWRRRAIQFEKDWFNRSQKTIEKKLADHYQKSLSAIQDDILKLYGSFAKDNGLNFYEAKKLLNSQEYRRWRMSMQEYLQKIADGDIGLERELNTLAMRPRINRLEKLYAETLQELDKLGRNVDADIKNFLADGYTGTYAKDIFDLVKVGGLSVAIAKVENIHVEKVLASRWSGKTFSQRIWTNTKLLNGVLRETISNGVHRGLSIPQMSKMVEDKMNAGYKNAVRLVRTEMNFFNNQAHADSMADAGVAAYEFIAVMDNRTSAACRSRDGETYPLEEKTVGFNYPPLHPRCRSTVCPFIEGVSRKGTRTAKVGGKNIDIPENMKYADYEKVYIKKEISFDDWRKNNLNKSATGSKINSNGSNSQKGLGAGDKIFMNVEGTPPKFIGRLPNLEKSTIEQTLVHFENQIANAKIENGFIITADGEVYHCTGHLVGLPTIEDLGEKLKGAIVTHNHPNSSVNEHSFSGLDWSLFERYNLKILRGVEENFVYELNHNKEDSKLSDLILNGRDDLDGWHNVILIKALNKGYGYRRWRRE